MKHKRYTPYEMRARMKDERVRKGLSCVQLGKLIGRDRKAICAWESGDSCPNIVNIMELCTLYGCSMDYLTGRSRNRT